MSSHDPKKGGGVSLGTHKRILPNGLILLAVRKRSAPTLAATCSFEINRLHEPERKEGIVHLVGESLDEGTLRRSGTELAEFVEGYGGFMSTGGGGATVQFASEDLGPALDILSEVVREPSFPEDGVRRAKELTVAEILSDEDDPRTVAGHAFRKKVYGDHPYGRPAKGSMDSVRGIEPEDLKNFHETWFRSDNAIIAAVGDVEPELLLDELEKRFESWERGAPGYPSHPDPLPIQTAESTHLTMDKAQVQVHLGHLGIKRKDPDFFKLRVMDHILGSGPGFTNRIARKLRDEQGLCYAVGAGITGSAGREKGLFSAYMGTSPGQEGRAIEGFLAEMRNIRKTLPGEGELSDVKEFLTGSFVWTLERNSNLAGFLIRVERFELGHDYIERLPERIRSVTREDVRDAAERHLDPERYHLVTLGPGGEDTERGSGGGRLPRPPSADGITEDVGDGRHAE